MRTNYIATINENMIKESHQLLKMMRDKTFNLEKKLETQKASTF